MSLAQALPQANLWMLQARSDLRVAKRLLGLWPIDEGVMVALLENVPAYLALERGDLGCHIAAACAQCMEKSIKGYLIANGTTPRLDHRPHLYIPRLLGNTEGDRLLRHKNHYAKLSGLLTTAVRGAINELFTMTPGGGGERRTDVPNTEYPWKDDPNEGYRHTPYAHEQFASRGRVNDWYVHTNAVYGGLSKLVLALASGPGAAGHG